MNETFIPTYRIITENNGRMYGKYLQGKSYKCIQDDSLLDSQIRLIDESGYPFWESVKNFICDYTPYLVNIYVEIELDLVRNIKYFTFQKVWYLEAPVDILLDRFKRELTSRGNYQVRVLKIY